jgi:hypothetical protein
MSIGPGAPGIDDFTTGGFDPAGFDPAGFDVGTPETGGLVVSRNRDRPFDLAAAGGTIMRATPATPAAPAPVAPPPTAGAAVLPVPAGADGTVLRDQDRPFDLAA